VWSAWGIRLKFFFFSFLLSRTQILFLFFARGEESARESFWPLFRSGGRLNLACCRTDRNNIAPTGKMEFFCWYKQHTGKNILFLSVPYFFCRFPPTRQMETKPTGKSWFPVVRRVGHVTSLYRRTVAIYLQINCQICHWLSRSV
jgi:hypothetical protein